MIFSCRPFQVEARAVDATVRGTEVPGLPISLGLRPQVLTLKNLSPRFKERLLPVEIALENAQARMEEAYDRLDQDEEETTIFHRYFFNEISSLIYAPFYRKDGLIFDAVLNKPLGKAPDSWPDHGQPLDQDLDWDLNFIGAVCPLCGWDLQGPSDSLAAVCSGCRTAWRPTPEGLTQVEYRAAASIDKPAAYLPFWRIKTSVQGVELRSPADLVKICNLPKAPRPDWETKPLFFWTPAFKVHPHLFMRLLRILTTAQPEVSFDPEPPVSNFYGVSLSAGRAAESLKTGLAHLSQAKRALFPKLPQIEIFLDESFLIYFPFSQSGRELVMPQMLLTVSRSALDGFNG